MNGYSFPSSALLGFLLAVGGAGLLHVLLLSFPPLFALKSVITAGVGAYILFIMLSCKVRVGRVVVPLLWCLGIPFLFMLDSLAAFVCVQAAQIWLVRCFYLHRSLLAVALDALLSMCAVGFALWAHAAGNWLLTFWAFYLAQSFSVWIPRRPGRGGAAAEEEPDPQQRFAAAARAANAALNRIVRDAD